MDEKRSKAERIGKGGRGEKRKETEDVGCLGKKGVRTEKT